MIRRQLITALDFGRRRRKKGEPEPKHGLYTYHREGVWYIVEHGPTYSNTYKVLEFDEPGLAQLRKHEESEALTEHAGDGKEIEEGKKELKEALESRRLSILYPVGTPVRYWTGAREGEGKESRIRSEFWAVGGVQVAKVDGHPAGIAITHLHFDAIPTHLSKKE